VAQVKYVLVDLLPSQTGHLLRISAHFLGDFTLMVLKNFPNYFNLPLVLSLPLAMHIISLLEGFLLADPRFTLEMDCFECLTLSPAQCATFR
jgi:hypothetical protein